MKTKKAMKIIEKIPFNCKDDRPMLPQLSSVKIYFNQNFQTKFLYLTWNIVNIEANRLPKN